MRTSEILLLLLPLAASASYVDDAPPGPAMAPATGFAAKSAPGADGKYEIDLLVVYTSQYAATVGDVAALVQGLNERANTFFANSRVPVQYRVVSVLPAQDVDESEGFYQNRTALALSPVIAAQRNAAGADLVLLLRRGDGVNPENICGLSSPFNNAEQSDPPANVNPERDAFVVLGHRCMGEAGYAHELGHALAGGHEFRPGIQYWRPYSHAIACGDAGAGRAFVSVMFSSNVSTSGEDRPLGGDFFSNPELALDGVPCGTDGIDGVEATQANNARAMTEAAPYVAAYRTAATSARSEAAGAAGALPGGTLLLLAALVVARRRCAPISS